MEKPRLLSIMENDLLGKGGFGFVCKGELIGEPGTKVSLYMQTLTSDCSFFPNSMNKLLLKCILATWRVKWMHLHLVNY